MTKLSNLLRVIIFVVGFKCFECQDVDTFSFFDIEQIKRDLFTKRDLNTSSDQKCLRELNKIASALVISEQWALKVADSWAKMPSGVYSGNFYEFGAFSQCFNIERDEKLYEAQYCLAHLAIDETPIFDSQNQTDIEDPEMGHIFPVYNFGPGLTFGICVPKACSPHTLKSIINGLIHKSVQNVSIIFPRNTCQVEETPSKFKTLDIVAIALLATVLSLILLSTSYDVHATVKNRDKSQLLLTFSFYTNGKKLLSYKRSDSPDLMHCLHGIRAISTAWVLLGHTCLMYSLLPIRNTAIIPTFFSKYHSMIVVSGPIAVDSFLILSGMLVSINLLKHLEKTKGKMNVLLIYLHRYMRLTPLLAVLILFSMTLFPFFGSGPFWPNTMQYYGGHCERTWWATLLYVQNYHNPGDICIVHSWYLAVDMQLFFISPAIVYFIYKFKRNALYALSLLVLGCIGFTVGVHLIYGYTALLTEHAMGKAYFPTHVRYASWLIGAMSGYFFITTDKISFSIPKGLNILLWATSLTSMMIVIFANYPLQQVDTKATPMEFGLYEGLSRVVWAIALCYIIFACVHNSGGAINQFLSHPLWQPFSRLSYSIYLLHLPVIMVTMASMKNSVYFEELTAFHFFLGNYVLTVFVSILASLAFESPILIIEKLIFGSADKSQPNVKNVVREIHHSHPQCEQVKIDAD